jgi:hypothetical protein
MKLLTLNFLTCARKACKQEPDAFPLHPRDAELERVEQEVNPEFLVNVLPRLDWKAIRSLSEEVSLTHHSPSLAHYPPTSVPLPRDKRSKLLTVVVKIHSSAYPPSQKQHQSLQICWIKQHKPLHKHCKIYINC